MRPMGSPEALERRRMRALQLWGGGLAPGQVARRVGVTPRSLSRWRALYRRGGRRGLQAIPLLGRPPKLEATERKRLVHDLLKGAQACGFPTDLWTCPRVALYIRKRFKVHYHVDHLGRVLRSLGFSPQRPQRRAIERNEAEIERWRRDEWPRVKKTLRGGKPGSSSSTPAGS